MDHAEMVALRTGMLDRLDEMKRVGEVPGGREVVIRLTEESEWEIEVRDGNKHRRAFMDPANVEDGKWAEWWGSFCRPPSRRHPGTYENRRRGRC